MEFTDEFRVSLPVEPAWELLNDVERIAPCMPGARLTGAEGDTYQGTVKVRVGPVVVEYKGTATVESRDHAEHAMSLRAAGRDSKGQGNAEALVTALLAPDGDGTRVTVNTRLTVTGKIAQFGRGVIGDVSKKLIAQFTTNLEDMLAAQPAANAPAPESGHESTPAADPAPTPQATATTTAPTTATTTTTATATATQTQQTPPDTEPLDLLGVARGAILKRLVPAVVVAALVIAGVVIWRIR